MLSKEQFVIMKIPSYQIYNVLKSYSKQVQQRKVNNRQNCSDNNFSLNLNGFSEEKRQAIVAKVASDIFKKIGRFEQPDTFAREIIKINQHEKRNCIEMNETQFVFNEIDENGRKTTKIISIEDPGFIINRLEQLFMEAFNKKLAV